MNGIIFYSNAVAFSISEMTKKHKLHLSIVINHHRWWLTPNITCYSS